MDCELYVGFMMVMNCPFEYQVYNTEKFIKQSTGSINPEKMWYYKGTKIIKRLHVLNKKTSIAVLDQQKKKIEHYWYMKGKDSTYTFLILHYDFADL